MTKITSNMRIEDVVRRHPRTIPVFQRHGLDCARCHAAKYETIGEGAQVHNLALRPLILDLNRAITTNQAEEPSTRRLPVL